MILSDSNIKHSSLAIQHWQGSEIDQMRNWVKYSISSLYINMNTWLRLIQYSAVWYKTKFGSQICVSKLTIIGSDNGLSHDRRLAIIWTNARLLLIGPLGTNFSEILIKILTFSFKKMRLKVSFAKRRPFCLGLNVLTSPYAPNACQTRSSVTNANISTSYKNKNNSNITTLSSGYLMHWWLLPVSQWKRPADINIWSCKALKTLELKHANVIYIRYWLWCAIVWCHEGRIFYIVFLQHVGWISCYHQISNTTCTKSQNLNGFRLVL